jgi:hypothetical protein
MSDAHEASRFAAHSDLEARLIPQVLEEQLRPYVEHLLEPDKERALILMTHVTVERLLGDMLEATLANPAVWLDESDYRSRTNLARALNLIGDEELNVCRVLGSARNQVAHKIEPLAPKWRIELLRLAAPFVDHTDETPANLAKALHELVIQVAAPWLTARVQLARRDLIAANQDLWHQLGRKYIRALPVPLAAFYDRDVRNKLMRDLENEFAAELAAQSEKDFDNRAPEGPA